MKYKHIRMNDDKAMVQYLLWHLLRSGEMDLVA